MPNRRLDTNEGQNRRRAGFGVSSKLQLFAFGVLTFGLLTIGVPAVAAAQDTVTVEEAKYDSLWIEGNARVPESRVRELAGLDLSKVLNVGDIQRAIRALMGSGEFDDVRVEQLDTDDRSNLVIVVKERPILRQWTLKGVKQLELVDVRKKIGIIQGRPIDRAALAKGSAAVVAMYRKKGYYMAAVKVEEKRRDTANVVELTVTVDEGYPVVISRVDIDGNSAIKDDDIVKAMESKPEGFFWFRDGAYSEDEVEADVRIRIPELYASRGFIDLRVVSDTLISATPGKAILKIVVDEGKRYHVGKIELIGNNRFSNEELAPNVPFGAGALAGTGKDVGVVFDQSEWDAATARLETQYANAGYIRARIEQQVNRRTTADGRNVVDLSWRIDESLPAIIGQVYIKGNHVTHERVIREQILLLPGAIYNQDYLLRSWQNISNLNFFEQVQQPRVTEAPSQDGKIDITFEVVEKATGTINFGASIGQGIGVGGFVGFDEPNLFGRAKRGRVQAQFGANISDFSISYSDPAIMDSRTSGTVTLFSSRQRYTVGQLGRIRREGGTLQLGFPVLGSRHTRIFGNYGYQRNHYQDTPIDLAEAYRCQNGCSRSSLGVSLMHDDRIGLPFPVAGRSLTTSLEFNGGFLGGSGEYRKVDLEGRWYAPLYSSGSGFGGGVQLTLGFTAKSGFVFGDVGPFFYELYTLGGVQYGVPLRGYDEFSITPKGYDPSSGETQARPDAFGKAYSAFTLEFGARVSQQMYFSLFSDAGNVYSRARQYNPTRLFRSVGIGMALISPLGPLGIDLGYGLDRTDANGRPKRGWQLHFRVGNFF